MASGRRLNTETQSHWGCEVSHVCWRDSTVAISKETVIYLQNLYVSVWFCVFRQHTSSLLLNHKRSQSPCVTAYTPHPHPNLPPSCFATSHQSSSKEFSLCLALRELNEAQNPEMRTDCEKEPEDRMKATIETRILSDKAG